MTMHLTPDIGVPLTDDVDIQDLRQGAIAACETAKLLEEHGLDIDPTDEDKEAAATLAMAYAKDPEKINKQSKHSNLAKLTPATLVQTRTILDEFGHLVAQQASEIRHLVTNKLIMETENPDARVRLKALELLGKISDVGLFTDRTEVTITHQSTDDLKAKLREKLEKLRTVDVQAHEIPEPVAISVSEELGL
jgi:hypothetical protein